ncbi:MAG: hypothetical protein IMW99_00635 [Firmicutes bacterium]|nr:hypothetical protein [Bacillota bacterium]
MSTVVGLFARRQDAEFAVQELRNQGFGDDISVVAKDDKKEGAKDGGVNLTTGATTGGVLGGAAGLLAGVGALAIPGIGPVIAMGPIAAGLTGAVAGGLAGSLVDLGIPQQRGRFFEEQVRQGRILAAVKTDSSKAQKAADILRSKGAQDVEID